MPIVPTVHATGTEVTPYIQVQQIVHMVKTATTQETGIVKATFTMPDESVNVTPMSPKVYSTGRIGFFAQINKFVYNGIIYGGQIQMWRATDKKAE